MNQAQRKNVRKRGSTLLAAMFALGLMTYAGSSYINSATQTIRIATRQNYDVITSNLCEAGNQEVMRTLWRPFKISQKFTDMDNALAGATISVPKGAVLQTLPGVGKFSAAVISYSTPDGDTFTRNVVIRTVGWLDRDNDNRVDNGEPRKTVDVSAAFQLARSQVFDYTYFVNNYGWMDGFQESWMAINGDMRANGDMQFLNGSPTVNGSIYAAVNEKLSPRAGGLVNLGPVKWGNSRYATAAASNPRMRPAYNSSQHGTKGTDTYEAHRDMVFDSDATIVRGRPAGAVIADSTGYKAWTRTATGDTPAYTTLDTTATKEVVMPDLSDLAYYQNLSQNYIDTKATYADGTANPNFGRGASVEIWDSTLNRGAGAYRRIDTNGVVTGSAILVGTDDRPIRINGPVTFTQDVAVRGTVQGQGTLYAGRNVHIVGSIMYKSGPDFRGSNPTTVDRTNEKRDFLGLAARGSVIMGDPATFGNPYPLKYMTPPFTKGRYDEAGNWIPPFNALDRDSTGTLRYKSVLGDSAISRVASGINQIDAVIYTNFVGGGNLGTGGGGVRFNGSLISRDEAMVVWSLPVTMNYDSRIRERTLSRMPLIDLQLPRSPVMLRSTWQDRGFGTGY